MSVDLSKIAPMTEAEADALFGGPSAREKFDAAMLELGALPFLDGHVVEDINRYVELLLQRIREARDRAHAAEQSLHSIRSNY